MMKFFALVALAMFATTNAASVAWTSGVADDLTSGATPGNLVIAITTSGAGNLANSQTITLTPSSNIFAADGATTCSPVTDATNNPTFASSTVSLTSTTAQTQKIIFTLGSGGDDLVAVSKLITITCTSNLAANANGGDVTFDVVTQTDTDALTNQVGYTLTSKPGWTSAARTNVMTGQVGGALVVKFTPTRAVATGNEIVLTSDSAIYTTDGAATTCECTLASGSAPSLAVAISGNEMINTMTVTGAIGAGVETTITCASTSAAKNNFADNGAADLVIVFEIKTTTDATALTAQTGYTLTEKMVGWTSATRASTVIGADGGILTFKFTPLTLIPHTTGYITLVAPTDFFTENDATTSCAVTVPAAGGVTFTTGVTAKTTLKLTLSSAGELAAGVEVTVVCQATNLAANSATAGDVTFSISTSADVGVLAAQTGYTLAAATSAASSTASVGMLTMLALAGVAMRQ